MPLRIVIDVQEKNSLMRHFGLKENDTWKVKDEYSNYVSFEQLNCGDVLFIQDDKPVVLIERKQVRDLATCISSKSYKEQKLRMLKYKSENPQVELVYLVEEFHLETKRDLSKVVNPSAPPNHRKTIKVLLSAIVSTMLRDNFKVMITQGMEGTVAFIERIYEKYPSYYKEIQSRTEDANLDYMKNVKTVKKSNIDAGNWYMLSLSHIPGMSVEKAQAIANEYANFQLLIDAYENLELEKSKENMLKNIKIKKRNLGPVLSKRVYEYVMSSTTNEEQ